MHNFRELNIWKKGMELANELLVLSKDFPNDQKFGLTSQITRSAISIPSNIAEGSGRTTDKEFARFLDFSQGSAYELETQLILSKSFNFINDNQLQNILNKLNDLQRMINGFKRTLT